MSTVLEKTDGKFKVEGVVVGIDNDNATREGYTKSDKHYKSLSFFVETSEGNRVRVELFGMVRDEVVAYSQKAKKSKRIAWDNRHGNFNDYKVLGVNMFLEPEKEGDKKNKRVVMVEYDAVDYIKEHLKDGDVVRINGEPDFQEYENDEGERKQSTRFSFRSITKLNDAEMNFDAEDFKEVSSFEQEIVVSDTMVDDENNKLIINAFIIKYNEDVVSTSFVVDGSKYPKLANNMAKRLNFGDFIKVYGHIVNKTIKREATEEEQEALEEDAPIFDDWGGDDEIQDDFNNDYITDYINEMQIISVDSSSYEPTKYKEEDLISKDEDVFNGDVFDDFSDEEVEEEIDDLPFA